MTLDRFYPIFDTPEWLARTLPLGVRLVQLRMKDKAEDELRAAIATARDLCRKHEAVLVVNDYWQLAIELGCDWVHLGQEDLDTADIPAIRKARIKIGVSTHDHQELDRALSLEPDYIAFGPIYDTTAKDLPFAPQGVERLKLWRELAGGYPLVAIGGITLERAPDLLKAGADSVAVISDVLAAPDPEARARAFIEATRAFA